MRRADLIGPGLLVLLAGFAALQNSERAPVAFFTRAGCAEREAETLLTIARAVGRVDFEFPLSDGEGRFSLAEWRGRSKIGVVVVREGCPYSDRLVEGMKGHALPVDREVLFVSVGDRRSARRFKERNELSVPVLVDSGGVIVDTYHLRALPAYLAVDLEGEVEAVAIGEDRSWALMKKSRPSECSSCGSGYNRR